MAFGTDESVPFNSGCPYRTVHYIYIHTYIYIRTVEPPNNGHVGNEHFVHCSEVVPSSEVEMYGQLMEGGKQFVHCREVILLSEFPLSEVLCTYTYLYLL